MNEKEMNTAILEKLYEAAADTWMKMEKSCKTVGNSYTAAEVWKGQGKDFCLNSDDYYTISVEGFSCSLTGETVFQMVDRFERLCRVGKRKRVFASMPEAARPAAEYSVAVEISRSLADIACYAEKPDSIRRHLLKNVYLDIEKRVIYATDGYRMLIKPLKVLSETGDAGNVSRVAMIKPAAWMRMCMAAKYGAELTCKLITEEDGGKTWISECTGVVACTRLESRKIPYNIYNAIPPVSNKNVLSLYYGDWLSLRKSINAIKDENALITFRHDEGAKSIAVTLEHQSKFFKERKKEYEIQCELTPAGRYCLTTKARHVAQLENFDVFVPKNQEMAMVQAKDGKLTMIMPCITPDAYELETPDVCDALEVAGLSHQASASEVAPMDVQPLEEAEEYSEAVEPQRPQTAEPASKPRTDDEVKTEPKPEKAKERKAKPAASLDTDVKKFTLAMVGVNVGETLIFVDGTRVTAAVGNKVEYKGKLYTLTGYCKAFMPEAKRNKANSYRGCEYFFNASCLRNTRRARLRPWKCGMKSRARRYG